MIAPNSIASRKTTEPVRTTMRRTARAYVCRRGALGGGPCQVLRPRRRRPPHLRALRRRDAAVAAAKPTPSGGVPRRRRGSSGGIPLLRNPLADQRKCTESVSPPSSSPDRPPPKRLPGGRAFNLRRSVLGALGNLLAHLAGVKHPFETMCRKLRQSRLPRDSLENLGPRRSAPRAGAPSSGLPTDRRRSDCLSEGHQPQALRPRCTRDTKARSARRQVGTNHEMRSLRSFLFA
jgi:hypothetical protein